MSTTIYNRGLDDLHDWETGTFTWILVQGDGTGSLYTPDPDHQFVADLTDEVSVASYSRVTPTTRTRTVDNTGNRIVYACDNPDFGDLETTEAAKYLVLARVVTNDADSPLVCALDLGGYGETLGPDFIVHLHPDGFAVARKVAA